MSSTAASSPTDLFESLSINSQMSPTTAEVRSRAIEVRDILSSFDRDLLPAEFRTDIFPNLERPLETRPRTETEYTIQGDTIGSLLQWGAFDEKAWEALSRMQSPSTRARCFYEKLQRRVTKLFEDYDRLSAESFAKGHVRTTFNRIIHEFNEIVAAVEEDRKERELGQEATVTRLVNALRGICERNTDILPTEQTQGAASRSNASQYTNVNLFDILIGSPSRQRSDHSFIVGLLERYPPACFEDMEAQIDPIVKLLTENGASERYVERVRRLGDGLARSGTGPGSSGTRSESCTLTPAPSGSAPPRMSTPASTQAGSVGEGRRPEASRRPEAGAGAGRPGAKRSADGTSRRESKRSAK